MLLSNQQSKWEAKTQAICSADSSGMNGSSSAIWPTTWRLSQAPEGRRNQVEARPALIVALVRSTGDRGDMKNFGPSLLAAPLTKHDSHRERERERESRIARGNSRGRKASIETLDSHNRITSPDSRWAIPATPEGLELQRSDRFYYISDPVEISARQTSLKARPIGSFADSSLFARHSR